MNDNTLSSHIKVCVWCNIYNQASYIKDTMEGFCIQQTQFPFVCLIMDDASTDGEPIEPPANRGAGVLCRGRDRQRRG